MPLFGFHTHANAKQTVFQFTNEPEKKTIAIRSNCKHIILNYHRKEWFRIKMQKFALKTYKCLSGCSVIMNWLLSYVNGLFGFKSIFFPFILHENKMNSTRLIIPTLCLLYTQCFHLILIWFMVSFCMNVLPMLTSTPKMKSNPIQSNPFIQTIHASCHFLPKK